MVERPRRRREVRAPESPSPARVIGESLAATGVDRRRRPVAACATGANRRTDRTAFDSVAANDDCRVRRHHVLPSGAGISEPRRHLPTAPAGSPPRPAAERFAHGSAKAAQHVTAPPADIHEHAPARAACALRRQPRSERERADDPARVDPRRTSLMRSLPCDTSMISAREVKARLDRIDRDVLASLECAPNPAAKRSRTALCIQRRERGVGARFATASTTSLFPSSRRRLA